MTPLPPECRGKEPGSQTGAENKELDGNEGQETEERTPLWSPNASVHSPPDLGHHAAPSTLCAHLLAIQGKARDEREVSARDRRDLLCPGRPIPSAPAHRGHDRCGRVPSPACFRSKLHSRRWQWPHPCSCWSSPSFPVNLQAQLIPQGPFPRGYAVWNTTQTLKARGFPQAGFAPCAHTHIHPTCTHGAFQGLFQGKV